MDRRLFLQFIGCGCLSMGVSSCSTVPITDRKQLKLIPEAKLNAQAALIYEKIKKLEGSPRVIKNLFSSDEINKFLDLYKNLPTTVHNTKQNVIKKRWLKNINLELEKLMKF